MNEMEFEPATAKPRLRWYQYSLRGLLLVTTILAMALTLLKWLYTQYGLEVAGLSILATFAASLHAGCALWLIEDARKRGKSSILLVALFAYFGPFGVLAWLLLRPPANDPQPNSRSPLDSDGPDKLVN